MGSIQGAMPLGVKERNEDRKTRKMRSEEEEVGFQFTLPITCKETGWNNGTRGIDAKENPRSWYCLRLGGKARPHAHSRYIHIKQK